MKHLFVITSRITDHRHYRNTDFLFLDTTLMTGEKLLAPTPDLLWPYKRGDVTEGEYTRIYKRLLWDRYRTFPDYFRTILHQEKLCLACYCGHGKFCHRHLLVDALTYFGTLNNVDVEYGGEPFW